jgi:DNA (cytosine-5)-methyltransferase 1
MTIRVGSLFTGVGGFDLGFERAGMKVSWQCEIDKQCQTILKKHFPNTRLYEDVRSITREAGSVDLICGGFPCQDLSVAGKRKGLAGSRSGLWFEFARIIEELKPGWVVIENVPGLLSSNKGKDFAIIIQWLVQCGYGVSWRILDSQYFGVAQRRRRVFIIGSLGSGNSTQVLFEPESLSGNIEKGKQEGKEIASTITDRVGGSGSGWARWNEADGLVAQKKAPTLTGGLGHHGWNIGNQDIESLNVIAMSTGQSNAEITKDKTPTLSLNHEQPIVAFNIQSNDDGRKDRPNGGLYVQETDKALTQGSKGKTVIFKIRTGKGNGGKGYTGNEEKGYTLKQKQDQTIWQMNHADEAYRDCGNISPTLQSRMGTGGNNVPLIGIRRLTPVECERLQGFPDGWTDGQSDTHRYKQMGNAVTVNVIEWIGKRIMAGANLYE